MFQKLKDARHQRRYTQCHREVEDDGMRLMRLDDHMQPTYIGKAPWCDTVLHACPLDGMCCACTHRTRNQEATDE